MSENGSVLILAAPIAEPVVQAAVESSPFFTQTADTMGDEAGTVDAANENKFDAYLENGDEIAGLEIIPFQRKSGKRNRGIRFRLNKESRHQYSLARARRAAIWRAMPKGRKYNPE